MPLCAADWGQKACSTEAAALVCKGDMATKRYAEKYMLTSLPCKACDLHKKPAIAKYHKSGSFAAWYTSVGICDHRSFSLAAPSAEPWTCSSISAAVNAPHSHEYLVVTRHNSSHVELWSYMLLCDWGLAAVAGPEGLSQPGWTERCSFQRLAGRSLH